MAKITFDGNLGQDPELKYFNDGTPVCNLNVGHTPRKFNKQTNEWEDDGATQWYAVSMFGPRAEALTEALSKGSRVHVEGKLTHREYQRKDGSSGVSYDVLADSITLHVAQDAPQGGMANGGRVQGGVYPVWGAQTGAQGFGAPPQNDPWTTEAPF